MDVIPVQTALMSVSDKTGLCEFAGALTKEFGIRIISTGGTYRFMLDNGIQVEKVEDLTQAPEMLGGRVKTLHPAVFGGILARRDVKDDMETLKSRNYPAFDLVVVNLYPFAQTVGKADAGEAEIIENIDIGGVALIRAAAKNFYAVIVVTSPEDYSAVIEEMRQRGGVSPETRRALAMKAFKHTAVYDHTIWRYFAGKEKFPEILNVRLERQAILRYGENPHQQAAIYRQPDGDALFAGNNESCISRAQQLHGKEISYNNMSDADAALEMVREFSEPAAVIVKHANPCGVAVAATLVEAYQLALECDPVSAFGGIVALNRTVDSRLAEEINKLFTEVVVAPAFDQDAFKILTQKKNLRLLATGVLTLQQPALIARSVTGGMLLQDRDLGMVVPEQLTVVTKAQPTEEDIKGLLFAWKTVKWVKSNAIVFTLADRAIAIGAGQMSRIDSCKLAAQKARTSLKGTYMGSDAFFPFRDCVDFAAEQGVKAIIQPGGSLRDQESIDAANEHDIIMVLTGMRHFRH